MKLFYSYQLKEFFRHFTSIFLGITLLAGTIRGILILTRYTELNLTLRDILTVYLTSLGEVSAFSLSFASFLSLLFVIHRMKLERELLALFSLGYTFRKFLWVILIYANLIVPLLLVLTLMFIPWAKRVQKMHRINLYETLAKGKITERTPFPIGKNLFLYVQSAQDEEDKQEFKGVFLIEDAKEKKGLYYAKRGSFVKREVKLSLEDGSAFHKLSPEKYDTFTFTLYEIKLSRETFKREDLYLKRGEMTLTDLKESIKKEKSPKKRKRLLSELYGRFFYPLTTYTLFLQAYLLALIIHAPQKALLFFLGSTFYLGFSMMYNFWLSLAEDTSLSPLTSFALFHLSMGALIYSTHLYLQKKGSGYL